MTLGKLFHSRFFACWFSDGFKKAMIFYHGWLVCQCESNNLQHSRKRTQSLSLSFIYTQKHTFLFWWLISEMISLLARPSIQLSTRCFVALCLRDNLYVQPSTPSFRTGYIANNLVWISSEKEVSCYLGKVIQY